jgi:hypothetical protein
MPFSVVNLFFPVVIGALLAPATTNRSDGTGSNEPPLVGIEEFATVGLARERARGHG